jgi:hypothetical protein
LPGQLLQTQTDFANKPALNRKALIIPPCILKQIKQTVKRQMNYISAIVAGNDCITLQAETIRHLSDKES